MPRFTWDITKTDPEIYNNGVILTTLTDITSARLQPLVEFISEVIEIKLDFRQTSGRYMIMCKADDFALVSERWDLLGRSVSDLQAVYAAKA